MVLCSHHFYLPLLCAIVEVSNKGDGFKINTANATVVESPYKVNADDAEYAAVPKHSPLAPAPIDPSIDKWFFLSGK